MMKWILPTVPSQDAIISLAERLNGIPVALAALLWQRKVHTLETAKEFFYPHLAQLHDPMLMKDMNIASNRLCRAITCGEPVFLLGDYDVDGTTSVSMMTIILEALKVPVFYHIPDRYKEGYGVSYVGIDAAVHSGAKLLITLDCGIRSMDQIKYAQQRGLEVIICDHHEPGNELPPGIAVLDPKRVDCQYPFKELTGCGVGYKLMQACVAQLGLDLSILNSGLDLLALSIACDIVPIIGENRILMHHGLVKLRENPVRGLAALMSLSDRERLWTVSDLVFFLGPRINAAGRITHAKHAVDVLTGKEIDLSPLAKKLEEDNALRKQMDENHTRQALELVALDTGYLQRKTTVLYHPEWHKGLVGIVASRMIEKYYRPTVLLARSEGNWVGSARSVAGFDLYAALLECKDHILQFGGHKYAAGMTISEEHLQTFMQKFEAVVAERILPEHQHPVLRIDAEVSLDQVSKGFVKMVNKMAPFGPGNLQPVFVAVEAEAIDIRVLKDQHLKIRFRQGNAERESIGFGMADKAEMLEQGPAAIAFHADINVFRGQENLQLTLKDIISMDEWQELKRQGSNDFV
jgi:single-stranded-DNA-specific exonuclease